MEISSVEPVTILVHHVDFGSYDTVPTSRSDVHSVHFHR